MHRRRFLSRLAASLAGGSVLPVVAATPAPSADKVVKSADEWKKSLTAEQFYILREEGTERPFSSPLNNEKRKGTFVCAACALPLFESSTAAGAHWRVSSARSRASTGGSRAEAAIGPARSAESGAGGAPPIGGPKIAVGS